MKRTRDKIVNAVAKALKIDARDIMSKGRNTQEVAHARQLAMTAFVIKASTTLAKTAIIFRRHPSTVTHAVKKIRRQMRTDSKLFRLFDKICRS